MNRTALILRMLIVTLLPASLPTLARADGADHAPWLGDLVRVRFEGGGPVVYTALRSTTADGESAPLRVRDGDRAGDLTANVLAGVDAAEDGTRPGQPREVVPEALTLRSVRTTDDPTVTTEIAWRRFGQPGTELARVPRTIDVQQSIQGKGFLRLIRLTVRHDPAAFVRTGPGGTEVLADGQDWPVRFTVNEVGGAGQPPVNVNAVAPSFAALRLRNPREVEQFLRPLFTAMAQEAVFAPDPLVAFQVFAGRWGPDPDSRSRVEALVPVLGTGSFRDRERATTQLRQMGRPAVLALLRLDRSRLSAEQCLRADSVLRPFMSLPASEVERLRHDRGFLLDCLYGDDAAVRAAGWDRLKELAPGETSVTRYDPSDDPAARSAAAADLRQRLTVVPAPAPSAQR
jgi:hypothetical protein